eukprot:COSAG01_NODE_1185_length_11350_cov_57.861781_8_plen_82_part_00
MFTEDGSTRRCKDRIERYSDTAGRAAAICGALQLEWQVGGGFAATGLGWAAVCGCACLPSAAFLRFLAEVCAPVNNAPVYD